MILGFPHPRGGGRFILLLIWFGFSGAARDIDPKPPVGQDRHPGRRGGAGDASPSPRSSSGRGSPRRAGLGAPSLETRESPPGTPRAEERQRRPNPRRGPCRREAPSPGPTQESVWRTEPLKDAENKEGGAPRRALGPRRPRRCAGVLPRGRAPRPRRRRPTPAARAPPPSRRFAPRRQEEG